MARGRNSARLFTRLARPSRSFLLKNESAASPNKSLTPKQLAAFDACKAKGFAVMSAAFKACIEKQLTTVTKAARDDAEAELKQAVAACSAMRLKTGDLMRQCIQTKLGK